MRLTPGRFALTALLVTVLVLVGGLVGGGWYLSDLLKDGALQPKHEEPKPDLEVAALGEGQITLHTTPLTKADGAWTKEGLWGLKWEGGYGQVGDIVDINQRQVVRRFFPGQGTPPIGQGVRLDSFAYPGNPQQALGIPYQDVTFTSSLGEFSAWSVAGNRSTWVIFVHGRNSTPREALRMLPAIVELGVPALAITYRNDEGEPRSPDGFLRFGQTEWEDLEGAVTYALEHGARDVVLVGYSMGGGIVVSFLYNSRQAAKVRGVILDAPMLNFGATVDLGARQKGYPKFVAALGKAGASLRFSVDWKALDYLRIADRLAVPILLFHGTDDDTVPVETSDALTKVRSDIVKYVRVVGATHVGSWNHDPTAYKATVQEFLLGLVPAQGS